MNDKISRLTQKRYVGLVSVVVVVIGLSWWGFRAWRQYTIRGQLYALRQSLLALKPDNYGRFRYDLVEQIVMVERLKQEGAPVETAECLGRLHLSSNQLCRGSATLLLLDLNEAATLALPVLKQTASNADLDESVRNDASRAIEMIFDMLCGRVQKTMRRTPTIPDESNDAQEIGSANTTRAPFPTLKHSDPNNLSTNTNRRSACFDVREVFD